MKPLKLFAPGLGPNSIAGSASTKLLTGSNMDAVSVMLRETIQNSWDARGISGSIHYRLKGIELSDQEINNLKMCIDDSTYGKNLTNIIESNNAAIQITDVNTTGLTGDLNYENNHRDHSKFLKFVFEVGNAKQGVGAGGSFGYGKASLFILSKVGTVAIYSRVRTANGFEERFIIKSINKSNISIDDSAGVYWWGAGIYSPTNPAYSSSMSPIVGSDASTIAASIGMDTLQNSETGTILLIYDPIFEREEEQDLNLNTHSFPVEGSIIYNKLIDLITLAQKLTVHFFWAKYYREKKGIHFNFSIRDANGKTSTIDPVNPDNISPYGYLLNCLVAAKEDPSKFESNEWRKLIRTVRPSADLGVLSWCEIDRSQINHNYYHFFDKNNCFVALMRNVEFVVNYMTLNVSLADRGNGEKKLIFAVYRTLDGSKVARHRSDQKKIPVEEVYRAAENQTHGEWSHQNLSDEYGAWCKTYIKQTHIKIEEVLNSFYSISTDRNEYYNSKVNVRNMLFLGRFISNTQGAGNPAVNPNPPNPGHGNPVGYRPMIEYLETTKMERNGAETTSIHRFKVINKRHDEMIRIYPICPDEDGNMKIKSSENVSLPVSLKFDKLENSSSAQYDYNNTPDGSVSILYSKNEFIVSLLVKAVMDCRYIVDIEIKNEK